MGSYDGWLASCVHQYIEAGNMKPASQDGFGSRVNSGILESRLKRVLSSIHSKVVN